MQHRTPGITLPAAAEVTVRRVNGQPALIVTDPATGTQQTIRFAPGHPGDACVTISSLASALRDADDQYMDAELAYEWQQDQAVARTWTRTPAEQAFTAAADKWTPGATS
jgi:xanthine/CO dehydrogenase XdhC/CoxF family maturation factor